MLTLKKTKSFTNGNVHLLHTEDGYPIETTDTFLPFYTKDAIGRHQNCLEDGNLGSRSERWMIGVSTMSGCPVGCKFCATGKLKRCRNLTSDEIIEQVMMMIKMNNRAPCNAKEFKINYTRMGEPGLNLKNVLEAIDCIDFIYQDHKIHHYISTIGIKGVDYGFVKNNITLQFSVHSFDEEYRNWLIPFKNKITIEEMGKVRTNSDLKTTLNLTMAREEDFNIVKLKEYFDPEKFFCKVSPINVNSESEKNNMGKGIITQKNLK
jgi:adenine C2-methylase RlmN of 23S rRNA A2503 and tRNA A37